jgi:hypothetical protein
MLLFHWSCNLAIKQMRLLFMMIIQRNQITTEIHVNYGSVGPRRRSTFFAILIISWGRGGI